MRLHLVWLATSEAEEIKFFLSNAGPESGANAVAGGLLRWRVNGVLRPEQKSGSTSGRPSLVGLKRHLILTSVSYLFLPGFARN